MDLVNACSRLLIVSEAIAVSMCTLLTSTGVAVVGGMCVQVSDLSAPRGAELMHEQLSPMPLQGLAGMVRHGVMPDSFFLLAEQAL